MGREEEKGKRKREPVQGFRFRNAGKLCHIYIYMYIYIYIYLGRKHNNNGLFLIDYTATKLG